MTIPLVPAAGGGPLLTYALRTRPDPLASGGPGALDLTVANATGGAIACKSLQLSFPIGTDATDLVDGGAAIHLAPPAGWTAHADPGVVTFEAPGGSVNVAGEGLVFTIATMVNDQPGTASVVLTEEASDDDDPLQQRSGSFAVDKFPADFTLSDLTFVPPNKPDVAYGDAALLDWTAGGAGVSCNLEYQPADEGDAVTQPVPNAAPDGGFETAPLTRTDSVTFSLTAEVSVLGQDNPMIHQRQLTITVEDVTLAFTVEPSTVGPNGLVRLAWNAANAQSCFLDHEPVAASATIYRVISEEHRFSMLALGAKGRSAQKQVQVAIDAAIVPTVAGISIRGAIGKDGDDYGPGGSPGDGGPGGDAMVQQVIAPLDVTGTAAVFPITLAGGAGGAGGYYGGFDGGAGGNASAVLTVDNSLPAVQYVVNITAGAGGQPGTYPGTSGKKGRDGQASLTIESEAVPLP